MESPTDGESMSEPVVFLPNVLPDTISRDSESAGLYSVTVSNPTNIMAIASIAPRTVHVIFIIFFTIIMLNTSCSMFVQSVQMSGWTDM